jgi:hypothetical protein
MAGYRNWLTNARQIRTGAVTASGPDMYAAALTLDSIGDQFDSGESQSGTLANRLARVLEKEGQRDKARPMYALAAAAGGAEIEASRQAVAKWQLPMPLHRRSRKVPLIFKARAPSH